MPTFVQRLAAALLTLLAFAAPAAASGHHHGPRAIASVKLVPLPGGGTLIHVRGAGDGRAVLHSPYLIAAAAIRDVDADGDLDVIADSGRGLVVWRNLGSGRYVLAAPPSKERLHRRAGPGLPGRTPADRELGHWRTAATARRSRRPADDTGRAGDNTNTPISRQATRLGRANARRPRPASSRLTVDSARHTCRDPLVFSAGVGPVRGVRMRVALVDLPAIHGVVSKDTVVGGYGSRLQPFSRVTRVIAMMKRKMHDTPSVHLAYLAAILAREGHDVVWSRGAVDDVDAAIVRRSPA